jgi:hypothetical protein
MHKEYNNWIQDHPMRSWLPGQRLCSHGYLYAENPPWLNPRPTFNFIKMQECGLMQLTQQLNSIGCGIITANLLIHIVLGILPVTIIGTILVPLPWFIRHIFSKEQLQKMSYRINAKISELSTETATCNKLFLSSFIFKKYQRICLWHFS